MLGPLAIAKIGFGTSGGSGRPALVVLFAMEEMLCDRRACDGGGVGYFVGCFEEVGVTFHSVSPAKHVATVTISA